MTKVSQQGKKKSSKLRTKYRFVVRKEDTYEERFSFRLSRLNVFVFAGIFVILLIVLTIYLIAFTPLREYIPGYTDLELKEQVYDLQMKADSIEREFIRKDNYINNIRLLINGGQPEDNSEQGFIDSTKSYNNIEIVHSENDSFLRAQFESDDKYDLNLFKYRRMSDSHLKIGDFNFFTPLKGMITNVFDPDRGHYGVDIVAGRNEAVLSTLPGVILFADWTVETGYVIAIQHKSNIISVYKHNSVLLKNQGTYVTAGEPIAIVGASGELSSGPHLHFELWYDGKPINAADYINFE